MRSFLARGFLVPAFCVALGASGCARGDSGSSRAAAPPKPVCREVRLDGVRHVYQSWNNCAAATLSMLLSYYGVDVNQETLRLRMKPDWNDPHVAPEEVAEVSAEYGVGMCRRAGGDRTVLEALLSAGFAVVVPTWHIDGSEQMGHYRLVIGYDQEHVVLADSLLGPEVEYDWRLFDEYWRVMNRQLLVGAVRDWDRELLATLLPPELASWEESVRAAAAAAALELGRDEGSWLAYPDPRMGRAYAYFNLGGCAMLEGKPQEAAAYFDKAYETPLPWRMLWYQPAPLQAWYLTGRYEKVVKEAERAIGSRTRSEELCFWSGLARAELGDTAGSRALLFEASRVQPDLERLLAACGARGLAAWRAARP